MTQPDDTGAPDNAGAKVGYIPKPPSQADIDEVSQDQALITDEWAEGDAAQPDTPRPAAVPPGSAAG